jgi:hypothetical protein
MLGRRENKSVNEEGNTHFMRVPPMSKETAAVFVTINPEGERTLALVKGVCGCGCSWGDRTAFSSSFFPKRTKLWSRIGGTDEVEELEDEDEDEDGVIFQDVLSMFSFFFEMGGADESLIGARGFAKGGE